MKKTWMGLLAIAAMSAGGCSDDAKLDDIVTRTSTRSSALVRESLAATQAIEGMKAPEALARSLSVLQAGFGAVPFDGTPLCARDEVNCGVDEELTQFKAPPVTLADEDLARVERFMKDRVFTEDNLEDANGDTAVFLLEGEDLCTDGTVEANAECVKAIDALEIRVQATLQGDTGIDLALWFGAEKTEPLRLELREQSAAAQVELAAVKKVIERISKMAGETVVLPEQMVGRVEIKIQQNGERDVTFSVSVLEALSMKVRGLGFDEDFSFSTAASPLASLRLDAVHGRVTYDVQLGTTELSTSGIDLNLSGASMNASVERNLPKLTLAHVGIGDAQSTLRRNGETLLAVDLNALSGRHFDVELTEDTDGLPLFRVTPELDLGLRFFLAPLKAEGEDIPEFLANTSYRVHLQGQNGSAVFRPVEANEPSGFRGGLKIVTGALRIESSEAGVAPVVVEAGQCLSSHDEIAQNAHPLLGHFSAEACR